jgi:multidrug transporter EmrE-like cation transporter
MQTNRTSQWAGYVASAFAIALFITVTAFYKSEETLTSWWPAVTVLCMMLAAFQELSASSRRYSVFSGAGDSLRAAVWRLHAGHFKRTLEHTPS